MPIVLVNTPSSVMEYLTFHYKTEQISSLLPAMDGYLNGDGQPLLDLFMDPKTRNLGSDASTLLKCMPRENLNRLINMIDDHIGKIHADEAQAEEAEQLTGNDLLAEQVRAAYYRGEI